jgi:hypothetical protein
MAKSEPAAMAILESIRADKCADLDANLLEAVFHLEHQHQFEDERGVVEAAIRDLISQQVEANGS